MSDGAKWLEGIADKMRSDVAAGAAPDLERLTVRDLLGRFGHKRRGDLINNHIRNALDRCGLRTDVDFAVAWFDATLTIELDDAYAEAASPAARLGPTQRVDMLAAAHRPPASSRRVRCRRRPPSCSFTTTPSCP